MIKAFIITVLLLLLLQTTFCQTKEIKGDTAFRYNINIELRKDLEQKDFENFTDEFNFRFRNHGQIVEISKDNAKYNGAIPNYIYPTRKAKRNKSEILSNKIILSQKQAEDIYNVVQSSRILELPSDNIIANWKRGFDGITYIIEHTDRKNYWFKNYWTSDAQDSIPEAIVVLELIKNLTDTLNLQKIYSSFQDDLPKKGCYNSGGMTNICYVSNSLEFEYSGATKLPLGFYSSYSAVYIGRICKNVLQNMIIPEFRNQNYFDGLDKATDEFIKLRK